MTLHIKEDMEISKYRLNKFVDKLVANAIDKINSSLVSDEFAAHTYRKPADNAIVFISGAGQYASDDTDTVRYVLDSLKDDLEFTEFYIWAKQNKWDKLTYIHSSFGYGNHYSKYFDDLDELTAYVMDELVPRVVDTVNKAYEDYVKEQSNVTESLTEDYKDSDAYKKLADYDYICDIKGNNVIIKWADDGHTYAEFTLYSPEEMFADTDIDPYDDFGKSHGFDCWVIYNGDEYIDTYAKTYDDAVVSAIKYFWTYY